MGSLDTGRRKTKQKIQQRKKGSTTEIPPKSGVNQVVVNGNQFMSLIRHSTCYSKSQYMFDTTMRKQAEIAYM